jgi:hypothetical protein
MGGYDGLIVRTNSSGDTIWQRTYGDLDWDLLYSVEVDPDGDFIVAGQTYSNGAGGSDGWLLLLNEMGDVIWQETYGGPTEDFLNDVQLTTTGGYVMAGGTDSTGNLDAWVVNVDSQGGLNWAAADGGDSVDFAADIVQTSDGGFSVIGTTESYSEWTEMYHYKLDTSGTFQWFKHWGQTGNQEGYEHMEIPSGNLVSVGYNAAVGAGGKDFYILISDPLGEFVQGTSYGGPNDDIAYSLARDADNGYVVAGVTTSYGSGSQDVWVVKVDSALQPPFQDVEELLDPLGIGIMDNDVDVSIWPRVLATDGVINIHAHSPVRFVAIFDMMGRELHMDRRVSGSLQQVTLAGSDLVPGTYVMHLAGVDWHSTVRLLLSAP